MTAISNWNATGRRANRGYVSPEGRMEIVTRKNGFRKAATSRIAHKWAVKIDGRFALTATGEIQSFFSKQQAANAASRFLKLSQKA